jgi:actin related protein 2/3 complex subunit 5
MAQATPQSNNRNITPQPTGFSQIHSRGGGEGGGQAMSVLLSWHEKVQLPDVTCMADMVLKSWSP